VATYGAIFLRHNRHSINEEERWLVSEQVAIAALECGASEFAQSLIREVARKFPKSSRTRRLQGMFWEASGVTEKAQEIYASHLRQNPTDEIILKRTVAVQKTIGSTQAAIETLRSYLNVYANDREAWEELADLYLSLGQYKQALFCVEELLMFMPTHLQYLLRMADVLLTMGGSNNLKLARSYYAKAVEVSAGKDVRALYGVLQCSAGITDKVILTDARSRAQIELPGLALQALGRIFKAQEPDKLSELEALLKDQKLLPSSRD
jgi:tetratricopeptide (TPR) repeat protein